MIIYERAASLCIIILMLVLMQGWSSEALAQSSYFSSRGCSGCHAPPAVISCNSCHAHGAHPNSAKNSINVAGTSNKSSYAPGETVTVTITGGYRTGWFRAVLYDQNSVELARSAGNDSGMGGSAIYPAVLSAPAPATSGSYAWKVAWYGNQDDGGGATFGPGWTADINNPGHGSEIVSITAPFTVAAAPLPAPTLSSVAPNTLVQGAANRIVTIAGNNLSGAAVSFSNPGITAGAATIASTSISLPVSVAVNATVGTGTLTVTTANGSVSTPFNVTAAAIPAPAISSVTPNSLVQGAANQTVVISGANFTGAAVSFSNAGVAGGTASITATSITLPVSVAANASATTGTVTITTSGGSATGVFNVTPRASAPTLTVSALSDGSYTNNATLNISGNASASSGVASVTVNGQSATVMPDGSFSTALTLVAGANTITVVVTDNAGSQKSDIRTINYDPIAPVLTISAPADNSTSTSSFVTVSGSVDETSSVTISNNDGSKLSATMNGNYFSATVNLGAGVNTINVVATDLAGNTSSVKRTVSYDTSKFTLQVTNPSQDMTTRRAIIILVGTVTNSSKEITITITMDGRTYTQLVTNGIFKQRLTFAANKTYAITVTASDAAGNSSTVTRNVIYRPLETKEHDDDNRPSRER